ncbi:MAG: hypothetical protein O7D91_12170 [Planctomycetota bacterium]|nr:hypothetical protein [Planctomycetota bacterium]
MAKKKAAKSKPKAKPETKPKPKPKTGKLSGIPASPENVRFLESTDKIIKMK